MHRKEPDPEGKAAPGGRPRDTHAEEAILQAALALFAEGGVAATTFDGVAKGAGVSRSTVYRRWRTRDDLLIAALQWLRARGEAGVDDWAQRPHSAVVAVFKELTVQALVDPHSMDLLRQVTALPADSPVKLHYWAQIVRPRRDTFSVIIRAARARGELPAGPDPDLLQDQLAGALLYRSLVDPAPIDRREAAEYVDGLLSSLGLLPARSEPDRGRDGGSDPMGSA